MPATPIRTALIGLSASAITSWAADAHLPAIQSPSGQALMQITALCNSSVAAAETAIRTYHLGPATVKAYGNPDDLAADPTVDLVICTTRVDKHYPTVLASLRAGKSVYIEWPITSTVAEVDKLLSVARASGATVAVGLQARFAPPIIKIKEILRSGRLGRLLSTEVRGYGGTGARDVLPTGLKYFAQKEVGGNPITIGFGHMIDYVQSVVGDVIPGTDQVHTQIQRPEVRILDPQTGTFVDTIQTDVPDLLSLHGTLAESPYTVPGASLLACFARSQPYPGDPLLSWTLNCESGSIRLTAPAGISLHGPSTISVHHHASDTVEEIEWTWSKEQSEVPAKARSVQRSLINFAVGNPEGYVSLEDAAGRARQIARWLNA
ncbi:NAD(P)-binding protein [Aspergillus sclerotioniger CBS 115572]|uniref:NAD(P)-binding protein n=1 Tax=Aspergillus sclerotioniger CBS 115572 TaxID=1450535 RepID=A0A317X1F1_9EURO|nr:NAD(P)-binding protein [Aspergillus sclerotioniger CBS 115572]PWY90370.1 NAD(P)-binding protein [Aspergillus sclerotioniger CBS 115572]